MQAVEKLLGLEVPERAQYLRVIALELNRIASHLMFLATFANDLAATTLFLYGLRERETIMDLFESWVGARLTQKRYRLGGVMADLPDGFIAKARAFCRLLPRPPRRVRPPLHRQPHLRGAHAGHRHAAAGDGAGLWLQRADAARFGSELRSAARVLRTRCTTGSTST